MISSGLAGVLAHQHYHMVGRHSAVKPCLWLKKSLRDEGYCYKQKFYGIESHRCIQMTPSVGWCSLGCVFCWRNTDFTQGFVMEEYDEPERIIEGSIDAQRQAISGFGGSNNVDPKKFAEANDPNQVAISLAGEPTCYPKLSELIEGYQKRDMTTYLVTNGTFPEAIKKLDTLPTNLYMSLVSPDELTHKRVCAPLIADAWKRIGETIELFPSLDTRKIFRITAVKDINMTDPKGYAKLIDRGSPDFVEVKAFMFVGGSRLRLTRENMPSHEMVTEFARQISTECSYELVDEKVESRVVLLKRT